MFSSPRLILSSVRHRCASGTSSEDRKSASRTNTHASEYGTANGSASHHEQTSSSKAVQLQHRSEAGAWRPSPIPTISANAIVACIITNIKLSGLPQSRCNDTTSFRCHAVSTTATTTSSRQAATSPWTPREPSDDGKSSQWC